MTELEKLATYLAYVKEAQLDKTSMTRGFVNRMLQSARDTGIRGKAGLTGEERVRKLMDRAAAGSTMPASIARRKALGDGPADRMLSARLTAQDRAGDILNDHGEWLAERLISGRGR